MAKCTSKSTFFFLTLLSLAIISPKLIEVNYNEEQDFITKDGKIYLPAKPNLPAKHSRFLSPSLNASQNLEGEASPEKEKLPACEEELVTGSTYWFFMFMVCFLTLSAGLMSGLTVGYLSVDQLTMELREVTGTPQEKEYSKIVLPVLSNRHWLLCTLLLMNSFAMEALPVFLDRILTRLQAVIISVTLLLIFGEVIPQALCTGPNQIQIAAACAPLTRCLMLISWPITFWLGKALDIILGEQGKTRYANSDLKALVEMHTVKAIKELSEEEQKHPYIPKDEIPVANDAMGLGETEAGFILGALENKNLTVAEIMTRYDKVYCISYEEQLTQQKLMEILGRGFSRIPVYRSGNKNEVIGLLRIKQLIGKNVDNKSIKDLKINLKPPIVALPKMKITDLFKYFAEGKSHLALVTEQDEVLRTLLGLNRDNSVIFDNMQVSHIKLANKNKLEILGMITLEDIIEKLCNFNILDEDDYDKFRAARNKQNQVRNDSKINMMLNKDVRDKFIEQQTVKIEQIVKGGFKNEPNLKQDFLSKMETQNNQQEQTELKETLLK